LLQQSEIAVLRRPELLPSRRTAGISAVLLAACRSAGISAGLLGSCCCASVYFFGSAKIAALIIGKAP
jgi:hypothetical protein